MSFLQHRKHPEGSGRVSVTTLRREMINPFNAVIFVLLVAGALHELGWLW